MMKEIQCIFCNTDSNQIVIEENGYKGRICPKCGLIYISPRPSSLEIQNLYRHDQAHASAKSHISGTFGKRLCAKHNLRIIKKFFKNGSMLEIGAGAGYFLNEARKEGFEVYAIELNSIQADFIRSKLGISCEESSLNASSFGGKKFSIVYHDDVISHFYDPIAEFKKINDRLKDKGILVFETGNLGDVKEKYYRTFTRFQLPDHLFFFGEDNLKQLLRRTGFELIEIFRYSILPQLRIIKILRRARAFIKSQEKTRNTNRNNITEVPFSNIFNSNISRFCFKQLIKNAYCYFLYLIRYKIGYVMPKKGRPQTVIVIARKRA
jgi:2-polyprenyl-3-methyl-5-hydroxy-6-metoxy-1,4-benzoquinol methylase